jgi:hypothetical protein
MHKSVWNNDILSNTEGVVETILRELTKPEAPSPASGLRPEAPSPAVRERD